MEHSQELDKIAPAISKMQSVLSGANKNSENPFFKSDYADLQSVWEAIRKPLTDNGLSVIQSMSNGSSGVLIDSMLLHTSGQWIKGQLHVPLIKMDPQAVGSAISYGRRYMLAALVGIYQKDDDAETVINRAATQVKPATKQDNFLRSPNGK
jgi:hypothetical protein